MADNNKKKYIKYEDTTYILEDSWLPDPTGFDNKVLGVDNANHGNDKINTARITKGNSGGVQTPELHVLTTAAPDVVETMYLAGFYYTEDIPTTSGGES